MKFIRYRTSRQNTDRNFKPGRRNGHTAPFRPFAASQLCHNAGADRKYHRGRAGAAENSAVCILGLACPSVPAAQVKILPPIDKPIHDILCVGVNYRDHQKEASEALNDFKKLPQEPFILRKERSHPGGRRGNPVQSPIWTTSLITKWSLPSSSAGRGKDIPKEEAENYIFGYSVFNDISSRRLQNQHGQWFKGKSLETHTRSPWGL